MRGVSLFRFSRIKNSIYSIRKPYKLIEKGIARLYFFLDFALSEALILKFSNFLQKSIPSAKAYKHWIYTYTNVYKRN